MEEVEKVEKSQEDAQKSKENRIKKWIYKLSKFMASKIYRNLLKMNFFPRNFDIVAQKKWVAGLTIKIYLFQFD